MARPIWKGAISFGLVTVPVGLYSATARNDLSFRLLHAKDGSPVEYKRFCKEEDVEVPWSQIVKGYEYERGKFVVMTDENFERARTPATQTIDITDFVPQGDIDLMFLDQPCYLVPEGKSALKAYALLRDALRKSERVGIATIVMRERQHLAALQPVGEALVLTTMRFADEIRSAAALDLPQVDAAANKREIDLALKLIDSLASEFDPKKYKDTYREVLLAAIGKKVKGEEITAPKEPTRPRVANLMKALEASLREGGRRPLARAEGRKAKAPRRAAQSRRRAA